MAKTEVAIANPSQPGPLFLVESIERANVSRIALTIRIALLIPLGTVTLRATATTGGEIRARHGLSPADYQKAVTTLGREGFGVRHVDAHVAGGRLTFAAIWEKGNRSRARHGLSPTALEKVLAESARDGLGVTRLCGYEDGGRVRFAGVWKKDVPPRQVRFGLTSAQYNAAFAEFSKRGYRIASVAGYAVGGRDRYAAIWEKRSGPPQRARHGMTSAAYQSAFERASRDGFRIVLVDGYSIGGVDHYAALWEKSKGPGQTARHLMTSEVYEAAFRENARKGYELRHVSGSAQGASTRYAAIWQRPSGDPLPDLWSAPANVVATGRRDARLDSFDDLLTKTMAEHNLPGAAVAVARSGRLVYSRGFGYADVAEKRPVQPTDLFRIASLSKPITAVAVLQLAERGRLQLDESALGQLGLKPTRDERMSRITVRQLLQHTGGFDRSKAFDPMFKSVTFARERRVPPPAGPKTVIQAMLERELQFDPGTKYAYSNFGYCLLGRLMEQASGRTYEDYVKEEVLKPLGIDDMHVGRTRLAGRRRNEVRYYTARGTRRNSVFADDLGQSVPTPYGSWYLEAMDSHGGWIASAEDLVRFATAFENPERCRILKPESIRTMFAPPAGSVGHDGDGKPKTRYYGCGWSVRPTRNGGTYWHTGSLDGTSTLLVRRHDGLSWAVLFNTRDTNGKSAPASLADSGMHRAADAVKRWP